MNRRAAGALLLSAVLTLPIAAPAAATTLQDAMALALAHEPGLQKAKAEADAAGARAHEADAARLPSVTLSGQTATGRTDFGQFFGFGTQNLSPRSAHLTLEQPLFAGGALSAASAQAKAARAASNEQALKARLVLQAKVAQAYGDVLVAEEAWRLNARQLEVANELARQAGLQFRSGASPRTDEAQAQARAAGAQAGVAQAQGNLARARAQYHALVGQEPADLAPFGAAPEIPASLDLALAAANKDSPDLASARAGVDAARAGVSRARGGLMPQIGLFADASSVRDEFLPGYRADGYTVGVQAKWTLFSSGLQSARISEAQAQRRAAEAAAAQARSAVEEAVIAAWSGVETADRTTEAARLEVNAAAVAETSLSHETKVGEKPLIDLLNAQKETLAARTALARAQADRFVARYQLLALIGER